jgi:BTB/POZ domain
LYTATIEIQYSHNIKALVQMSREFGHSDLFEDVCSGQLAMYIDSNGLALAQLQKDLLKLFTSTEEHKYGYFADTLLITARRSDEEQLQVQAHRIFINRSTFLRRCFRAGMEESQHGRINFEEIGSRSLQTVLRYLYSDEISLPLDLCAEVYIAAKLLELTRLQAFCRSLLFDFMDADNVLDLLQVAEMYVDEPFLERCFDFIGGQQLVLNAVLADARF